MEKTASAGDRAAGAQKSELDTTAHRALNFAPRQELCTVTDRMLSSWRPSDRRREAVSAVGRANPCRGEERAGFEPSLWRQNLPCFCATALLPLCRSEFQFNPDEKGAILAAGSTPLGPPGNRAPRLLTASLA